MWVQKLPFSPRVHATEAVPTGEAYRGFGASPPQGGVQSPAKKGDRRTWCWWLAAARDHRSRARSALPASGPRAAHLAGPTAGPKARATSLPGPGLELSYRVCDWRVWGPMLSPPPAIRAQRFGRVGGLGVGARGAGPRRCGSRGRRRVWPGIFIFGQEDRREAQGPPELQLRGPRETEPRRLGAPAVPWRWAPHEVKETGS